MVPASDSVSLIVRQVRWNRIGAATVQVHVEYSDYREVAGVKMPFTTIVIWTDGQDTITEENPSQRRDRRCPVRAARPRSSGTGGEIPGYRAATAPAAFSDF